MYSLESRPKDQSKSGGAQSDQGPKSAGRSAAELSRLPDALVDIPVHYTITSTTY